MGVDHQRNLGFFRDFMIRYGQASTPTRLELYRDTQAYSYGAETAATLYQQVGDLLGVYVPSPQVFAG